MKFVRLMWGIDFMNARQETPVSTRQETPLSTRQETPVNFDYRACGGGLHESLADLGPQVKEFTGNLRPLSNDGSLKKPYCDGFETYGSTFLRNVFKT